MLEEKTLQILVKELEQARATRTTILGNRQLLFTILIAAWSVLVTLLVFSINKWGFDTVWGYFGAFSAFCLGGLVNLITILRMIVNAGELDVIRLKIRCIENSLSQHQYFPPFYMLLAFDFGESYTESTRNHYSSFTPRFHFAMSLFIFGNGVITFFAAFVSFAGIIQGLKDAYALTFPTYTYLLLLMSALCLGLVWYSRMMGYYLNKKAKHNADVAIRMSKYQEAVSPLVQQ